jgi:hypothetical protein
MTGHGHCRIGPPTEPRPRNDRLMPTAATAQQPDAQGCGGSVRGPLARIIHLPDPAVAARADSALESHPAWFGKVVHLADVVRQDAAHAGAMTITLEPEQTSVTGNVEAVSLDGGLFFQPLPVVERARQLARDGTDIVVTLPLDRLNDPRLTGVTRQLLEASVESHLRSALTAAGYRTISRRREVQDAMVLDATA